MLDRLKSWAKHIKRELHAVYLASHDPRVPWYAKAVIVVVIGYAFSPIDLIPDFIPVLGLLDDVILVPLGILLAIKLIPVEIMRECRVKAHEAGALGKRISRIAGLGIFAFWLLIFVWISNYLFFF